MPGIRWRLFTCFLSSFLTSFLSLLFFVVSSFFAQFVLWFFPSWAVLGKHALFCSLSLFLSLPFLVFLRLDFLVLVWSVIFELFMITFFCLGFLKVFVSRIVIGCHASLRTQKLTNVHLRSADMVSGFRSCRGGRSCLLLLSSVFWTVSSLGCFLNLFLRVSPGFGCTWRQ